MWSAAYVTLFVGGTTLTLWRAHWEQHRTINTSQAGLALFGSINALICLWEMSLFFHCKLIKSQFTAMKRKLPTASLPQPMFLFESVPILEVCGIGVLAWVHMLLGRIMRHL